MAIAESEKEWGRGKRRQDGDSSIEKLRHESGHRLAASSLSRLLLVSSSRCLFDNPCWNRASFSFSFSFSSSRPSTSRTNAILVFHRAEPLSVCSAEIPGFETKNQNIFKNLEILAKKRGLVWKAAETTVCLFARRPQFTECLEPRETTRMSEEDKAHSKLPSTIDRHKM